MHAWHSGRQCSFASALRADPEKHGFVQGFNNPASFVHVERDVRLLVDGDDFMARMPTHEEKRCESVSFSKYDGKCTGKFHSDGNIAMEASLLNRVIKWDPTSARAELEADTRHVAMARKPFEDTSLYRSVTMRVNYLSLDRPDLSFAEGALARRMKSPTTNSNVLDAACGSDQLEQSCLSHKHCLEFWRRSATQTMLETRERAKLVLE